MNRIRKMFGLICVFFVIPTHAELTSNELNMFEELASHVKSLEWKLNKVESELEGQKEINRKQENELEAQKILIDKLKTNSDKLKQNVEKIGKRDEIIEHFLKKIMQSDATGTNENLIKNVQRHVSDKNIVRVARQEPEHVAFSAFLNRDLSNLGPGQIIQYGAAVLNEGNAFNVHTGIFTVPVSGVYMFLYACEDFHSNRIYADIMVDGTRKSLVLESPSGLNHAMGTNVVILRLAKGQAVWVAIDASGHDDFLQNSASTFSGVFLYY